MELLEKILNGEVINFTNEKDYIEGIKTVENNTEYIFEKISSLKFIGDKEKVNVFKNESEDFDSSFNIIAENGTFSCRPYSVKSLCERIGISGSVLAKFDNEQLANLLQSCIKVYKDEDELTLAKIKDKCIAVLSDGYRVLWASDVFRDAIPEIEKLGGRFIGGLIGLDIFEGSYLINNKALKDLYDEKFDELKDAVPIVSITTSNTGLSSVTITPKFRIRGVDMIIGKSLRNLHKGSSTHAAVKENIGQIFAMFKAASEELSKLKKVKIENPLCCLKNVAKRVLISKKYAMMAAEDFENFIDDEEEITAYDVYFALSEVVFHAENDDKPKLFLNNLQEQVSRALFIDFSKYDTPYSDWN